MKPVRIAEAAEADLRSSRMYFNTLSPALGDGFLLHVEDALDRLADHPDLYQLVFDNVRRLPLHRFPYNVFYRVQSDHIEIIGVLHAHSDPVQSYRRAGLLG